MTTTLLLRFYRLSLLSSLSAAVVGVCLGAIFVPVSRLAWYHFPVIILSFGLAGLGVGWLGWRQANSRTAVALIGLIAPLASFLLVVNALPNVAGYLIWDDGFLWYGTAVVLWLLLIGVLGLVGTAVAAPNGQSFWHKLNWRLFILALILVSFFGPWGYDLLSVPSQYSCEWPTFRVQDDFCGYPVPGILSIVTSPAVFLTLIQEMFNGADFRPFLLARFGILFSLLTPSPILMALLRRRTAAQARERIVSVKVWGVALIGGVGFLLWYSSLRSVLLPLQVWGIWSYVLLASLALLGEGLPLVLQRDSHGVTNEESEFK